VVIPRKKIQIARVGQGPLQARCGVANIEATSAAIVAEGILEVGEGQALAYLEWIRPRNARH
jgi:membrane protein YdbS with pleckstrin-like domain